MCVRDPCGNVARIFGNEREFSGSQSQVVDIVNFWVFFIQADEEFVREMFVNVNYLRLDIFKWRQIPGFLCCEVCGIETPVFVAANILDVENMFVVLCPKIETYPSTFIFGDRSIVLIPDSAYPYV